MPLVFHTDCLSFQFVHIGLQSQRLDRLGKLRLAEIEEHAFDRCRLLADRELGDAGIDFQ